MRGVGGMRPMCELRLSSRPGTHAFGLRLNELWSHLTNLDRMEEIESVNQKLRLRMLFITTPLNHVGGVDADG